MKTQNKSNQIKTLPFCLASIIQKITTQNHALNLDEILLELKNTNISLFLRNETLLHIEVICNNKNKKITDLLRKGFYKSNKFTLFIELEPTDKKQHILSLSFLNEVSKTPDNSIINIIKQENISKTIIKYFDELEFKTSNTLEENKLDKEMIILQEWAKKNNLRDWYDDSISLFPNTKIEFELMRNLIIESPKLTSIPKEARALKSLRNLSLVGRFGQIPSEIYELENLEKLYLMRSGLSVLTKDINKLKNLKCLILLNNNIQELPNIDKLTKLESVDISSNRLTNEEIKNFKAKLPKNIECISRSQKVPLPFFIEPLAKENLEDAQNLMYDTFEDQNKYEKQCLVASLDKKNFKKIYEKNAVKNMDYWIAKDKKTLEVIGLTGLYNQIEDKDSDAWLAWFCIDKKQRTKGYGKALLNFSVELAKNLSKDSLKLYTYDSKEYLPAMRLYEKYGFEIFDRVKKEIFYKLNLGKIQKKGKIC